jgi:DNA-binding NtrC family response regulator
VKRSRSNSKPARPKKSVATGTSSAARPAGTAPTLDWVLLSLGVEHLDELRLRTIVAAHIRRILDGSHQNVSLAARVLGMSRRGLQRKLTSLKRRRPTKKTTKK